MNDLLMWVADREAIERDRDQLKAGFAAIDGLLAEAAEVQSGHRRASHQFLDAWDADGQSRIAAMRATLERRPGPALEAQIDRYTALLSTARGQIKKAVSIGRGRSSATARPAKRINGGHAGNTARRRAEPASNIKPLTKPNASAPVRSPRASDERLTVENPIPNVNWTGVRWVPINGIWHAVLPINVTFCGTGADVDSARRLGGPACITCVGLANAAPNARLGLLPARLQTAMNLHERDSANARRSAKGRSVSVHSMSAGLPSMGKRHS